MYTEKYRLRKTALQGVVAKEHRHIIVLNQDGVSAYDQRVSTGVST